VFAWNVPCACLARATCARTSARSEARAARNRRNCEPSNAQEYAGSAATARRHTILRRESAWPAGCTYPGMPIPARQLVQRPGEAGVTLVDVLVALAVVMCAAAGVAGLVSVAARAAQTARNLTSSTTLAVQKMEQLKALTWTYAGTDAAAPAVTDLTTDVSVDPHAGGGRGLGASPAGTLDRNTPGYVDFLDAAGRWVGSGTTPPPAAVFVRRWSVEPLPAEADAVLMLQVLVTRVGPERSVALAAGERRTPLAGDARLATLSARRLP
jgi:hypothetical protein